MSNIEKIYDFGPKIAKYKLSAEDTKELYKICLNGSIDMRHELVAYIKDEKDITDSFKTNKVFDIISNKKFLNSVKKNSQYFHKKLSNLKNKYSKIIDEIRGRGFLIGIKLKVDQTTFIKKLMDNKLLTIRAAENVVRVLPPLNVSKKEIDEAISIIEKVCKKF